MYSYTATGRGHLGPKIQNFREKNCIAWAYFGGFSPPAYTEFIIIPPFFFSFHILLLFSLSVSPFSSPVRGWETIACCRFLSGLALL